MKRENLLSQSIDFPSLHFVMSLDSVWVISLFFLCMTLRNLGFYGPDDDCRQWKVLGFIS